MICQHCAVEFESQYQDKKYCTKRCRRRHIEAQSKQRRKSRIGPPVVYDRKCPICDSSFSTVQPAQIACSKACSKIHRRRTHDTRSGKRAYRNRQVEDYVYETKLMFGCSRCPERRPRCLQFHHIDPSSKVKDVSAMKRASLKKVKEEISKCILLCGNCHAVEENGDGYRDEDRPKGS